jgi:membrane-associated protein
MSPRHLLDAFGTIGLFVIIFAESGLLLGIILPGDSLLFTAGLFASRHKGSVHLDLALILPGCLIAAVAGAQVGYELGRRFGPRIFNRPESRLFKREYVDRAQTFFDAHGPKTILLARFVPIVRTLAPVLAGVAAMAPRTFFLFNTVGGTLWSVGVILAGYALGRTVPNVDRYLLPIIVLIIVLSSLPPLLEVRRHRQGRARAGGSDS